MGSNTGIVQTGKSYLLSSFIVKEFGGQKYLSMRKGVSAIEKIDDLFKTWPKLMTLWKIMC